MVTEHERPSPTLGAVLGEAMGVAYHEALMERLLSPRPFLGGPLPPRSRWRRLWDRVNAHLPRVRVRLGPWPDCSCDDDW